MPATTYGAVIGAVFWSTAMGYNIKNSYLATETFPTGITFGGRTHPLPGSTNLQYLSLDGNSATHRIKVGAHYADGTTFNAAITATRPGWCLRFPFAPGTSGTYTKPTSTAILIDGITDSQQLRIKLSLDSTGHFVLTVVNTSGAGALDFVAKDAIPDTVDDYQCEVWYDLIGSATQMVVRLVKISDRTHVDYINVNLPSGYPHTTNLSVDGVSFYVGENAAKGAGFAPHLGPFYIAKEDAADPYGLIRVDRMEPNGIGHTDEWGGNSADVDDSGTSAPDGVTPPGTPGTNDSIAFTGSGGASVTKTQLYDLTAPLDVTGSDSLTGAMVVSAWALNPFSLEKSPSIFFKGIISDGTNDRTAGSSTNSNTNLDSYQSNQWMFGKDPTGGVLGHGDLANLEAGVIAHTNTTGAATFYLSAVTVIVPYQKSGETVGAVATPPLPVTMMKKKDRMKLEDFSRTQVQHWPGILTAPVVVASTQRTQVQIF